MPKSTTKKSTEPKKGKEAESSAEDNKSRERLLRQAYGKATTELRASNQYEFNRLYAKHAKELGVEWHPRQTPEEKATAEFDALLEEYPFLRDRLSQDTPSEDEGEQQEDEEESGEG